MRASISGPSSMAGQQRGGDDMDHPLDIAARRQRFGRDERLQQRALGAGRERTLIEHPLERFRVCPQRPLDIEAHDVAGPLPDGIDRRLAIEPCQRPVLDIAIAAEALHRFEGKARQGLADAVFDRRRHQPNKGFLRRIRVLTIEGAGETEHQRGCRLDLERQIAQHLAHQRLLDERPPEGDALEAMVERHGKGIAHQAGGGHGAIETGERHHLDDGGDPPSLGAQQKAMGAVEQRLR